MFKTLDYTKKDIRIANKHMKRCLTSFAIRKNGNYNYKVRDFPGGTVVKSLSANAGDTGSSPGLGRFHMPRSS